MNINWFIDFHRKLNLAPETLYLSIYIYDKYLSLKQCTWQELIVLGVAILHLSAKYEEIDLPNLKTIGYVVQ